MIETSTVWYRITDRIILHFTQQPHGLYKRISHPPRLATWVQIHYIDTMEFQEQMY
jgi:hypothetical protein